MSLFSELMILLVSLTGIPCGMALAYIAPEELPFGRRYFLLLKSLITILIIILTVYISIVEKRYLFFIPAVLILILFMIVLKYKKINVWYYELINYLLFTRIYLFTGEINFKLLTAALIFFYGLPLGSMMLKKHETKKN